MSEDTTRRLGDYSTRPLKRNPQNNGGRGCLYIILGIVAGLVLCYLAHC
jgi:hypothetical protein